MMESVRKLEKPNVGPKAPLPGECLLDGAFASWLQTQKVKKNLWFKYGYIIPASKSEDASGIDFWIKLPRHKKIIPIQVTQRGTRLHRKFHREASTKVDDGEAKSEARLRAKRKRCKNNGIAFVLVRDYAGTGVNSRFAWGDKKALFFALEYWQVA